MQCSEMIPLPPRLLPHTTNGAFVVRVYDLTNQSHNSSVRAKSWDVAGGLGKIYQRGVHVNVTSCP